MKYLLVILSLTGFLASCFTTDSNDNSSKVYSDSCNFDLNNINMTKVKKTDAEWKKQLSDEEYYVTREKGTERAFTGEFHNFKGHGTFTCKCCELPLFHSDTKFNSGTGWPSFYQPIKRGFVTNISDRSYGMVRTEVTCARCDAHLGHVFPDGPKPTGLRYCINSVSLDFCKE